LGKRVSARAGIVAASCAVAAALGSAAAGIGAGPAPLAGSIDSTREAVALRAADLERISPPPGGRPRALVSRRSVKLSYFTTVNFETVVPGGDQLYELRCPARRQPLTGGVLSTTPGLAISNSSRTSPDPDRPTVSGAWYEGVVNLTATSLQWKPLVVCVRS
jgi:hypothetical protein